MQTKLFKNNNKKRLNKNNIQMKLDPVAKKSQRTSFKRVKKVHFQVCHLGRFSKC